MSFSILRFDFMEIFMIFGFIVFWLFYIRLQKYEINGKIVHENVCFLQDWIKKMLKCYVG